jgi:outer membrane protein TolC
MSVLLLLTLWASGQNILTLEEAVATTLQKNFSIRMAQNQSEMAIVNNTLGNAGFLPEVNLGIGQNFNINNTDLKFFSGETRGGTNQIDNINANLILGWTLFDGMQMFINRDRLQELEKVGKNQLRQQIENSVFEVMTIYYNLEQQRRRILSIEEAIALSSERLQLARTKKNLGKATESDILAAEVDILADSSLLIQEKWVYENLKVALNETMGTDPETSFEITETPALPPLDIQQTKDKAIINNTDMILADQNITLSELQLRQWKARMYPEVNLNGAYNFSRQTAQIGLLQFNRTSGLAFGLSATWNIFNGFNNKRETQWAKLNMQNQVLAREQIKNALHADIVSTINEYQTAMLMSAQEDKNLIVAQKNLVLSQERLNAGALTNIELRQAQLNLINVQFRKITADFNAKMADLRLRRLSGELWVE